jgi:photosynthetic reaction center cytochrome c subunit
MKFASIAILRAMAATCVVWLFSVPVIGAQEPSGQRPPMAEEIFKNVQILKGIPVDQFMGTMGFFSASTGLNCTDCHVDGSAGEWARYADDKALKQMARKMMLMVNSINKTNFAGRQVVTCNTCHRGSPHPSAMPSLDLLYSSQPAEEPGDPIQQAPGQPPADQILDRYLQAIGGLERVAALTSFTAKGNYVGFDDADRSPLEMYAMVPGQRTIIAHSRSGDTTWTFDGRSAWIAAPATEKPVPVLAMTGQDLDGVKLESEVSFPARIKQALTNWRTGFLTLINDRETNVVQGTTTNGGTATLCFDVETGLLVRLVRFSNSPVGRVVTRVDYSDYREVSGVKMPFKWTVTWLDGRSTYELTSVEPNVAIDASHFAKPAPSRPPRP